ncbi:MAG: hypothetical protein ACI9C1_002865 [Candidatus Aldehydirespiratoraceae bacterium]|jgi:hypothetical protein
MTADDLVDEAGDPKEGVRISDLDPRLRRTIEQLRRLPPGHRRDLPDPDNPSRPELTVYARIASMRAAVEQHKRDQAREP